MFELKPCPFCGAAAELKEVIAYRAHGWRVRCTAGCAASMPVFVDLPEIRGDGKPDPSTWHNNDSAARKAIETWNQREG